MYIGFLYNFLIYVSNGQKVLQRDIQICRIWYALLTFKSIFFIHTEEIVCMELFTKYI